MFFPVRGGYPLTSVGAVRFRNLFVVGVVIVGAQVALLLLEPGATIISNLLISIMALLAVTVCLLNAYSASSAVRGLWILLGSGFFLSAVGQIGSTYHEFATRVLTQTTALNCDFFFFAYGIPILLAICSRDKDAGLKSFVWLDGAQALMATMLVYPQIFSALPSHGDPRAISATALMYLYDAENWILVAAVTLRLFSNPGAVRKPFYRILSIYLTVYAIVALVLGYLELKCSVPDGVQDAAWGIPYLALLGSLAFQSQAHRDKEEPRDEKRSLALLIDNLSPLLFTLAIVLMGLGIAPEHPRLAFTCISIAIVIYGVRAAILQVKYGKSQEELTKAAAELFDANDRLMNLAIRDGLTGIHNRRHFDEVLQREWNRSRRIRQALSVLMIDVDCFKALNDRYGHQEGDQCLRSVALDVQAKLKRPDDLVARYGGEEFAVILPGADLQGALRMAEDIRLSIAGLRLPNEASTAEKVVTVSIGVSTEHPTDTGSAEELLKRADEALYRAKMSGRNQSQLPPGSYRFAGFVSCDV